MSTEKSWTFLTTHAQVLLVVARDPSARLIDISRQVGVTERTAQKVVSDLEEDGYLNIVKEGRRNRYEINRSKNMRHPIARDSSVNELLRLVKPT